MTIMRGLYIASAIFMVMMAVNGYRMFQDEIPNGGSVPHPCKPNYMWQGVGHQNVLGGGERNPFGLAFKAAELKWTKELCEADSDQDGITNGAELGDPDCVWSKGNIPSKSTGLSHPGICEPTDSEDCLAKNSWDIDCSMGADFTCPGLDAPDVVNVTLQISNTSVPAKETTYICQKLTIPSDKVYHVIASKPEIINQNVMHHIILYGCPDGSDGLDGFDDPEPCDMRPDSCSIPLGGWTVGSNGDCLDAKTGILVGKGHTKNVVIELHWNNPYEVKNYYDSSGLTLFMTPQLRENSISVAATGQIKLEIPGGTQLYTAESLCTEACSKEKLGDQTIYITRAFLHMHYLGISGRMEHWRNGKLLSKWAEDEFYSYDSPVTHELSPHVEFRPGDEIKTVCEYKSTNKNETTYFGESTSDEMCFGFFYYYPASVKLTSCVSWEKYDECDFPNDSDEYEDLGEPNSTSLIVASLTAMILSVASKLF